MPRREQRGPGRPDRLRVARMWRHELKLVRAEGGAGEVAGVDEAGRGPLAGPVVAAAVILPRRLYLAGLDDSKRVAVRRRAELAEEIKAKAAGWAVAVVGPSDIDLLNILRATHQAMRQALCRIGQGAPPPPALVDGLPAPSLGLAHRAVVDGDTLCPSIAAASILAKVHRDGIMVELDRQYPQYGFAQHKGYPTPQHVAALRLHGPCAVHRRSFGWRGRTIFEQPAEPR